MKNPKLFTTFFSVIFISLILQSCSNENLVSAPPNSKGSVGIMQKMKAAPLISMNHSRDTVITLPKSKKQ